MRCIQSLTKILGRRFYERVTRVDTFWKVLFAFNFRCATVVTTLVGFERDLKISLHACVRRSRDSLHKSQVRSISIIVYLVSMSTAVRSGVVLIFFYVLKTVIYRLIRNEYFSNSTFAGWFWTLCLSSVTARVAFQYNVQRKWIIRI